MTKPHLKKSRKPKCHAGVVPRWRAKSGWGFRAKRMIQGETYWGEIQDTNDEALQNWITFGQRAAEVQHIEELLIFDEAMKLMLAETEAVGCRPSTLRHYQEKLRPIWRHFQSMALQDITRQRIEDYRDLRLKTPTPIKSCRCTSQEKMTCKHPERLVHASPATVNKELQVLNRVFQVAIDKERLPGQNPVGKVRRLKTKIKEAHHYPATEVAEILSAIRGVAFRRPTARRFHDIVAVLFCSGMREGELGHLRAEHVDHRRGILNMPKEGKTGHRAIPMPEGGPLFAVLTRMVHGLTRRDYVLGGPPELTISNLKSNLFPSWRPDLPEHLRAGFHAHTFRHSFISHLGAIGVPSERVKKLSGHRARGAAEGYFHATEIQLRRDLELGFDSLSSSLLGEWRPGELAAAK